MSTRRNRFIIAARPDLHGAALVGRIANTQLSIAIITPSPKRAIAFNAQRVVCSCRNSNPLISTYLHGAVLVGCVTNAQLSTIIPPPSPKRAVTFDTKSGITINACDHFCKIRALSLRVCGKQDAADDD